MRMIEKSIFRGFLVCRICTVGLLRGPASEGVLGRRKIFEKSCSGVLTRSEIPDTIHVPASVGTASYNKEVKRNETR